MPGTVDEVNCVSPTPTMSSTGGDGLQDNSCRDFKDYNGIRSWSRNSRSSSALDRHSESSESLDNQSTCSGNGRQMQDFGSSEYIPTRSTKTAPKVAYNPMQFVKTGPTKLAQTAQEQLKKAEEVKKIREKKKDDAEDWQSNLEGWKSSRRKRQEHVIERVTEVKRMEQEEALKASEAATKRLMGIREKRGKLSALYSVEDNDEIEFDSVNDSADSSSAFDHPQKSEEETHDPIRPPLLPDYGNSIQDQVTFSTTTVTTKKQEMTETKIRKEVEKRTEPTQNKVAEQDDETEKKTAQDNAELVVVKRRSVFERDGSSAEQDKINNRRSGEFSSTFKNRLSTFEMTEASSSSSGGVKATLPDRDPQFKNKLASFHKVASQESTAETTKIAVDEVQEEKPDFKAKLAAFRQVEVAATSKTEVPVLAQKAKPVQAPATKVKPAVTAAKPVNVAPSTRQPANKPVVVAAASTHVVPEPIYANSSVAMMASRSTPPAIYHPSVGDAESSDCTEDEGIRSLSPHGTPSPTSPTRTEAPQQIPPPLPSHPPVGYSPYSFQQQQQQQSESTVIKAESSSGPSAPWPPASSAEQQVVWDVDWVDLGAVVQNAAPPSEKPPPPPPDEDAILLLRPPHSTTWTCSTTSAPSAPSPMIQQQQVTTIRRAGNERAGTDAGLRQELRKRRSDFLGFDVNAMEDDAKEMADAIPPPPDLKSLLRNATDYRASDLGLAEWQPPKAEQEELLLARKEREIIETLEKEEKERMSSSTSSSAHNRSQDGAEYEMTAEIDQLAREWQADTMLGPGWRSTASSSVKFNPVQSTQEEVVKQLHVQVDPEVRTSSTYPGSFMSPPKQQQPVQQQQQQQQASPPKPSRLSAAPKPRLHDGEAWMAKRKVASEGGGGGPGGGAGRKEMKDVSRHWLIQEAEQRRIDAMQERNYSPSSSSSMQLTPPVRSSVVANPLPDGHWMSRSSSSTSMDKMTELRLPKEAVNQSRSTSSLGSSPTPRPLYANQEEILEYADFTGAPHAAPPVWQVRSLVSSGSMDQLQSIHQMQPPSRPAKSQSQTLPSSTAMQQQYLQQQQQQQQSANPAQTHQPSWRSTHPPETEKEPIAPLPHSVITTLTQRMTQRNNNNNNNANYGDYMNVQEATNPSIATARAGPQVPAQRPANYRHPSLQGPSHSAPVQSNTTSAVQQQNNNDRMLSVSGKKKCSLCQEELGRGAAMIIESLRLFYHINCFRCCVCGIALGNGTAGTDVRVRNNNLHCHDCYSNDDGLKFSKV